MVGVGIKGELDVSTKSQPMHPVSRELCGRRRRGSREDKLQQVPSNGNGWTATLSDMGLPEDSDDDEE